MKYKTKYLILGAGLSGLSFANGIEDNNFTIIEKDELPGGYCKTTKRNGYVWDYAGHFFHFKNNILHNSFSAIFNEKKCIKSVKNTKIKYKNLFIDYPFQSHIYQLSKKEFIECLCDLYFRDENQVIYGFESMLQAKFGAGICNKFLIPYNEKLYACKLNSLEKDSMGRFFPYTNFDDVMRNLIGNGISKTYNDTFWYPYEGAQIIIDKMLADINYKGLFFNSNVERIDLCNKTVYAGKNLFEYEYLINSIPFNKLIKKCGYNKSICEHFTYNKVLVFNIGFDKPSIDENINWLYFPEKRINFYRVGFYNNILKNKLLSIYVEIGFPSNEKINIDKEFEKTIYDLKQTGIIDKHIVKDYQAIIMDPAYVHITKTSNKLKEKIKKELSNYNVYTTGRYGNWTYCSMEDCIEQSINLAKHIKLSTIV